MSFSHRRFTAPSLAVLAVAAVPLVAPTAANAALAGGFPVTTTVKPDLRTATVTTTPDIATTSTVRICFDKPVDAAALTPFTNFKIGAYDQTPVDATGATRSTANCVDATFPKSSLIPFTYVSVLSGAVTSTGVGNIPDSTALIVPPPATPSKNGTTGKTTGPDLTGIQRVTDTLARFTFDENVASGGAGTAYHLNRADGSVITGALAPVPAVVTGDKKTVTVEFAGGVLTAVRGYVDASGVASEATGDGNPLLALALPGGSLSTSDPDLTAAAVSADGQTVDFTFDEPVTVGVVAGYTLTRSDGTSATLSGGTVQPSPNNATVRFTILNGAMQNEYFVAASATAGAATAVAGGVRTSTAGGVPVGGNPGGTATGFTTAPDAVAVAFDSTAGTAKITLDQRFFMANAGDVKLLDAAGNVVANAAAVTGVGGTAGRVTATAIFTPAQVAAAKSLQLVAGAFTPFAGVGTPSAEQLISPTAP